MRFSFLLLLAALWPTIVGANEVESRKAELEALKQRLQSLQREFRAAEEHRSEAADELRKSERAISDAMRELRSLQDQQRRASSDLRELEEQAALVEQSIERQQDKLAAAIRATYQRGQADALKLLLSGRDPNQTARDLRYLAALSRAQLDLIEALRGDLARLESLKSEAESKSTAIAELQRASRDEQQRLQAERREREAVLSRLSDQITRQQREIATLQANEQRMTQLVERLNQVMVQRQREARARAAKEARARAEKSVVAPAGPDGGKPVGVNTRTPEPFQSDKPFSRLKGSLRLPVKGELMNRFGAPREGGGVSWKGLFIRAETGSSVKAVAAGQVVFSEWLRGFGNLIILDHGEGYMSLYSNTESLYKQVGDAVQPGDVIAAVGNSGGQPDTGLYFEMRHESRPIDPMLWVK